VGAGAAGDDSGPMWFLPHSAARAGSDLPTPVARWRGANSLPGPRIAVLAHELPLWRGPHPIGQGRDRPEAALRLRTRTDRSQGLVRLNRARSGPMGDILQCTRRNRSLPGVKPESAQLSSDRVINSVVPLLGNPALSWQPGLLALSGCASPPPEAVRQVSVHPAGWRWAASATTSTRSAPLKRSRQVQPWRPRRQAGLSACGPVRVIRSQQGHVCCWCFVKARCVRLWRLVNRWSAQWTSSTTSALNSSPAKGLASALRATRS